MKKFENGRVPFFTIIAAVSGNENAIHEVVKHYERYIIALSTRHCVDRQGREYTYIDDNLRRRLERKLIIATIKFKIR